ncbi:hypothetical protein MTYP_01953 [Methylophilaceae bacterium]|nr:hypothetical protein MTYP_01953 [Methylophilaceae bacterium]
MSSNVFLLLSFISMIVALLWIPDWPRQGVLFLHPAACTLVKDVGAVPIETNAGCMLEAKYDVRRDFTDVRLPDKQRLLISNAEITGMVRK